MRGLGLLISKLVFLCAVHYSKAVINVTLTGTTTRHVCKGEDIDFKWTYDDNNPDKNDIATIQWSKDPSGYLIMQYKEDDNPKLSITSSPNDYTGRVQRTTEAGSNDIGMRLKQAGATAVDDDGKYYVSLIVDKDPGDVNDYFVPYRDPQGVQVYVCVGVDDTYPLPSLVLRYDEGTNSISCTGPSSLGDTTFAIFDPSENIILNSTTDTTIETTLAPNRPGGTYRCKTYCTQQGYGDTPQGTCLPTDTTLVLPERITEEVTVLTTTTTTQKVTPPPTVVPQPTPPPTVPQSVITVTNDETTTMVDIISTIITTDIDATSRLPITTQVLATVGGNCSNGTNFTTSEDGTSTVVFSNDEETPCTLELRHGVKGSHTSTLFMKAESDIDNFTRRRRSAADRASSPGLSFNIIDENNFDMVYFRTNAQNCFEVGSFVDGTFKSSEVENDCGSYRIITDWFGVELHVSETTAIIKLKNGTIKKTLVAQHPFKPSLGLVQGPPYSAECSYDCRFSIRNLRIYSAIEQETDDMVEMDGFCSSPIRGGCLALIIVFVLLYLITIYVLLLICHTFIKRAHEPIPKWLQGILICVAILVPLIGAIFVAVYVYKKHCCVKTTEKPAQEHSGKYLIFKCPCKYPHQPYEANKNNERGRVSPCSPTPNKIQPVHSHEVHIASTKPSTAPFKHLPPDEPVISDTSPDNPSLTVTNEISQNNHIGSGGGLGRLPPIERVGEEETVDAHASHRLLTTLV